MKKLPWFRLYNETIDDEKLRLLAFEDRWHFIALLCCKGSGLLDGSKNKDLLWRKVGVKLGLATRELEEVIRRLAEVDLVDRETMQPLSWDDRQFISDNSTDRVRKFREKQEAKNKRVANHIVKSMNRDCNVSVTAQDTDTDTDTDKNTSLFESLDDEKAPSQNDLLEAEFEEWWRDRYPERSKTHSKVKAKAAYLRYRGSATKEQIWNATQAYVDELVRDDTDLDFVKMATTFLNDQPWVT